MAAASPRAPASPRPPGLGPRTHSPVTNNIRQGESGRVRQRHLAQLSSADQKQRSGGTSVTSRANSSRADVQAAYEALYYEGGFDTKEDADDMVSASLKRRFRAASYRLGGQDWEFLFSTCALSLRRALAALRAADSAPAARRRSEWGRRAVVRGIPARHAPRCRDHSGHPLGQPAPRHVRANWCAPPPTGAALVTLTLPRADRPPSGILAQRPTATVCPLCHRTPGPRRAG